MYKALISAILAAFLLATNLTGCADAESDPAASSMEPETKGEAVGHAHPTEGPNGGDLIELGNEEYHAELVHPHKGEGLTIYVLDGSAKEMVPIEPKEVRINVSHDGTPQQFKLKAAPTESDPAGKSCCFVSTDKELLEQLHGHDTQAKLVLTIRGKSYRGDIHHDHDAHAGHSH